MPSTCTFNFNKEIPIYFTGETIAGTITLNTTSVKDVRDVSIIFFGEGTVKFEEDDFSESSTYTSQETYINNRTIVHGDGQLPVGIHTYTYNIALPFKCPTSCEGEFGHIRYEIILKINRYYQFDNVFKKAIKIVKNVNLNLYPAFKLPLETEAFSTSCWCWPIGGKIFYTLKVPFIAYAPGQKVKYTLHIVNQSKTDCEGYNIVFTQKIIFTAKSPAHKQRESKKDLLKSHLRNKYLHNTTRTFQGEFLVPNIPPTVTRSSIISFQYEFTVEVKTPSCRNQILKLPIIIGTIPIRESLNTNQLLKSDEQQQVVPTTSELENHEADDNLLPSPPTYEEATCSRSLFIDTV